MNNLSAFLILLIAAAGWQENGSSWNFLRGNSFDGCSLETGLVDQWPAHGPPVLWTCKLGQGYSGFTGTDDRVFTQYQTLTGQFVVCLNADTGETLWQYRAGWPYQPAGLYPGPRATPTLDDRFVYFTTPDGSVGCLRQSDGELVWRQNLFEQFDAKPIEFGYSISPTIVDDMVILPVGAPAASIVAIDKSDGSLIWASAGGEISHSGALPITRNGRSMIVGYLKNSLVLLDQKTGQRLTEMHLSAGYDEHSAWPIYAEPYLWISAPFRRGSRLLEITDSDPPAFESIWQIEEMSNDVCSSVLIDGTIYGFDIRDVQSKIHRTSRGEFRAIDFVTGKTRWANGSSQRRLPEPGDVGHCALIYADGKLIMLNDSGELILASADSDQYTELARVQVLGSEICWTQPTIINGRLYVRNHGRAVCLYLGNPKDLEIPEAKLLTVADVPQSARIDWAGLLFAIEPEYAMDAPEDRWLANWFLAIIISSFAAIAIAAVLCLPIRLVFKRMKFREWVRTTRRIVAWCLGLLGTTLYSYWVGDFIFTWPLAVFVVFEICVYEAALSRTDKPSRPWAGRFAILAFLVSIAVYFFLCRRLSLAFEWAFLIGFPFAIPFLLLARRAAKRGGWRAPLAEWLWLALAVTAFYWAGAGVILWKY